MGPMWPRLATKICCIVSTVFPRGLIAFRVPLTAKIIGLLIVIIVLALTAVCDVSKKHSPTPKKKKQ